MTPATAGALTPFAPYTEPAVVLDGTWHTTPAHAGQGEAAGYAAAGFDHAAWQAVRLPRLGRATEAQNSLWYRYAIPPDAVRQARARPGERLLLHFGGAFYRTAVWLNGKALGAHEGYFQPFAFDVTERLGPHENVLAVCCRFPVEAGAFKRKTAVAGIFADWDCKPYPSLHYPNLPPPNEWSVPVGLWQPVSLRSAGPILIEALNILPELADPRWPDQPGATEARLRVSARLRNLTDARIDAALAWNVGPHNFQSGGCLNGLLPVQLDACESRRVDWEAALPDARLWFPWTHGEPWLYRAQAGIAGGGQAEQVFGVRSIQADFGPGRWEWRLNGRRVFPKGSNYVADYYLDRATPDRIGRDIELARQANLDMLRVHAHIAPPDFYRQCDEQGLMVMCDFPLIWTYAHQLPPGEAAQFRESVLAQTRDMIDLLACRPSIVLWSLHNEPPWSPGASFLGGDVHEARTNFALDTEAAALARDLDPSRPASAASGLHDQHLYHGWYVGGWLDNRSIHPPFPTEFGVQALPNRASPVWETVNTQWPVSADDPTWANAGYQSLFWASPGVGPPAKYENLDEYIAEGQRYQSFFIRYTIDQWRRQKFDPTGGYIHFLFTDCWPAITWSVLDYYRQPKSGYQALQAASSPVHLCIDPGDNFHIERAFRLVYPAGSELRVDLHLVNDDYRQTGAVRVCWRLERRDTSSVRRLLERAAGRLRWQSQAVGLPRADEGARLVAALRRRLRTPGEYVLRTEVTGPAGVLDRNELQFRVGEAQHSGRVPRHVPRWLVNRVYQMGSLRRAGDGITFALRNPTMPVTIERLHDLRVDGAAVLPEQVEVVSGTERRGAAFIAPDAPLHAPSGELIHIVISRLALESGPHELEVAAQIHGIGDISAQARDRLA